MTAPRIIHQAPVPHHHGGGLPTLSTGSVAVCECGELLIFRGSSGGIVGWHAVTRRERRRLRKRGISA